MVYIRRILSHADYDEKQPNLTDSQGLAGFHQRPSSWEDLGKKSKYFRIDSATGQSPSKR
jgi:hypothetical protein